MTEGRQKTATWLSPGTRKYSGEAGEDGSRNLLSNTVWATSALPSSDPLTVLNSFCCTMLSPFPSVYPRNPVRESTRLAPSAARLDASVSRSGLPGSTEPQPGAGQPVTATAEANTYPTTIDPKSPGLRSKGPEDWKNRMSACPSFLTKQILVATGSKLQRPSPSDGLMAPEM